MIRTPSMSSEDLAARMPLPGNAAIVISTSTRYLDLIKRETVPLLCHLARGRFIVNEVSQAVSTCSSLLRAEFQEGAPSMRARLGGLVRMCNLPLLIAIIVHHRVVRPYCPDKCARSRRSARALVKLVERRWFVIERLPITRDGVNGQASTHYSLNLCSSLMRGGGIARNASVAGAEAR